jgi:hypothetical protein
VCARSSEPDILSVFASLVLLMLDTAHVIVAVSSASCTCVLTYCMLTAPLARMHDITLHDAITRQQHHSL